MTLSPQARSYFLGKAAHNNGRKRQPPTDAPWVLRDYFIKGWDIARLELKIARLQQ